MNKKENPGVSRRGAAMLLLFSLAVSVLLGFAMPVHAADGGRTTLRVGFYPYTGYIGIAFIVCVVVRQLIEPAAAATPMSCCRTLPSMRT